MVVNKGNLGNRWQPGLAPIRRPSVGNHGLVGTVVAYAAGRGGAGAVEPGGFGPNRNENRILPNEPILKSSKPSATGPRLNPPTVDQAPFLLGGNALTACSQRLKMPAL
jgi:hypothetical protein